MRPKPPFPPDMRQPPIDWGTRIMQVASYTLENAPPNALRGWLWDCYIWFCSVVTPSTPSLYRDDLVLMWKSDFDKLVKGYKR